LAADGDGDGMVDNDDQPYADFVDGVTRTNTAWVLLSAGNRCTCTVSAAALRDIRAGRVAKGDPLQAAREDLYIRPPPVDL